MIDQVVPRSALKASINLLMNIYQRCRSVPPERLTAGVADA